MDPLAPTNLFTILTFNTRDALYLGIILLSIVISAFFAYAETALSQCNRFKLTALQEAGSKRAKYALRNLEKFDKSTISILIMINLFHIIASTLSTILFMLWMRDELEDLATIISTIVMTILIFLFSEMLPKFIANADSDLAAQRSAFLLYLVSIILTPLSLFFRLLVYLVKKIFKVNDDDVDKITEDDFQDTIEDIQEEGHLEVEESKIIQNAVDFGDYTVMNVLTPVDKMTAYNLANSARRDVIKFLYTTPYSRIPVYDKTVDNIVGILHVKKYLLQAKDNKNFFNLKSILSKPLFVSSNTKIDDMLDIFQESHMHIALVKDAKGEHVLGMVTMEDVVEKLVGDIDEKNPPKTLVGGDE